MFCFEQNKQFYNEEKLGLLSLKVNNIKLDDNFEVIPGLVNKFLKTSVEDMFFEDEDESSFTAYGALVHHEANCMGFIEAMANILNLNNVPFEILRVPGEKMIFFLRAYDKLYSPFLEISCERNFIDFNKWSKGKILSHFDPLVEI